MNKKIKILSLALVLTFITTMAMIAQNNSAQCKLLVSKGITITKIDEKGKKVNSGKTVMIPVGKHKITYDCSFTMTMGMMKTQVKDFGIEIDFEFETGKEYKLDFGPEQTTSSITQPGSPKITEIK